MKPMANQKSSSGLPFPVILVIGVVMMAGGFYVSKNWHPEFLTKLAEQGISLDPGKTVSAIGVLLILFPVIRSFYVGPLSDAINTRTTELERTFTEAESLRSEMTQMRSDYERRLAETESAAREQIQAEIRKAQELRGQLEADARVRADEYLRKAQEDIDNEKNRVITDLRLHVVDLTLGATEKILGESVDSDRNRKLIAEFIDKVEVPG